jgi:MarR family transcriptional regulator, organic hydroperoxide resistance regulator
VIQKRQKYLQDILSDFEAPEVQQLSMLLQKLHVEMKED